MTLARMAIITALLMSASAGRGNAMTAAADANAQLARLVSTLRTGEISKIDILQMSPDLQTRTRITASMLSSSFSIS